MTMKCPWQTIDIIQVYLNQLAFYLLSPIKISHVNLTQRTENLKKKKPLTLHYLLKNS